MINTCFILYVKDKWDFIYKQELIRIKNILSEKDNIEVWVFYDKTEEIKKISNEGHVYKYRWNELYYKLYGENSSVKSYKDFKYDMKYVLYSFFLVHSEFTDYILHDITDKQILLNSKKVSDLFNELKNINENKKEVTIQNPIYEKYNKFISIVIAFYNGEDYLKDCIESILNQTIGFIDNIEIILVNDGSTDNGYNICQQYINKYPENIKYVYTSNHGVSHARNIGLNLSRSEFIEFLDVDDYLSENAVEKLKEASEIYKDVDLFSFPMKKFEAKSGWEYDYNFFKDKEKFELIDFSDINEKRIRSNVASTFIKVNLIKSNKLKFNEHQRYTEDGCFISKLISLSLKLITLPMVIYYRRLRNKNNSVSDKNRYDLKYFTDSLFSCYDLKNFIKIYSLKDFYINKYISAILYTLTNRIELYKNNIGLYEYNYIKNVINNVKIYFNVNNFEFPFISIIIPCYNCENNIKNILDNLVSYKIKYEIICVNDCSKDNTLNVLNLYSLKNKNIKVINNENNVGGGESRNIGLHYALGQYIWFIDSDDNIPNKNVIDDFYDYIMGGDSKFIDVLFIGTSFYNTDKRMYDEDKSTTLLNIYHYWYPAPWRKLIRHGFLIENCENIKFKHIRTGDDVYFHYMVLDKMKNYDFLLDKSYYEYKGEHQCSIKNINKHYKDLIYTYAESYNSVNNINIKKEIIGFFKNFKNKKNLNSLAINEIDKLLNNI